METATTFGRRSAPVRSVLTPAAAAPQTGGAADQPRALSSKIPWATAWLLTMLIAVFALEMAVTTLSGHPNNPSQTTLLKLGGVSGDLVLRKGQAWRLLTAPMLHASPAHLIGNVIALILVGLLLEPIIGWRWFIAVYAVGGVAGALGSLLLNPGGVISVGASGAIMAMLATALILSFHIACYERRRRIRFLALRVGAPALLPLSAAGGHVDYSAHLAGVLFGMAVGYLLLLIWDEKDLAPPKPKQAGRVAAVIATASLVILTAAALLPNSAPPSPTTAGLVPLDDLFDRPLGEADRYVELLAEYPLDPRLLAFASMRYVKAGDDRAAAAELQHALDSPLLGAPEVPADLNLKLRAPLIALDVKGGDIEQARQAAAPFCKTPASAPAAVDRLIQRFQLCGSG